MSDTHLSEEVNLSQLCDFLNRQEYIGAIDIDALRAAGSVSEIGITSLGAIALTATYIRDRGLRDADFNPEWVPRLADVAGIVSVFAEIDALAGHRGGVLAKSTAA